jgi:acetylglutamate kinase
MSVERLEAVKKAEVLVEALPFIRKFHGDTIVVKIGGSSMAEAKENILEDIVLLRYVGMNPVVVHGGGPEITAWQEKMGIESTFVDGLRVTDEKSIEVVKMVLTGKVNPELVAALNGLGGQAVGMSGEDGPCILVKPANSAGGVDLGLVGEVAQVNPEPIKALLDRNYIPVVASLGLGYDGKSYNINADTVAAELAVALGARKLILLTDVEGIRGKNDQLITEIRAHDVGDMIDDGTVTGGMIPKVKAAVRALAGVEKAHIIDGRVPHALLLELLTAEGIGTMIVSG